MVTPGRDPKSTAGVFRHWCGTLQSPTRPGEHRSKSFWQVAHTSPTGRPELFPAHSNVRSHTLGPCPSTDVRGETNNENLGLIPRFSNPKTEKLDTKNEVNIFQHHPGSTLLSFLGITITSKWIRMRFDTNLKGIAQLKNKRMPKITVALHGCGWFVGFC